LKLVLDRVVDEDQVLSERHPEKQGLKLENDFIQSNARALSERHPEKQGLKLLKAMEAAQNGNFQSVIQKNKD